MDQSGHHNEVTDVNGGRTALHCVFRRGSSWLALPATAVREAVPRPVMVSVPGTPRTFVGLCHVRSEFIPVLNLDSVISEPFQREEQLMLVLDDADGPWALLIDEFTSLQVLDISDAPEDEVIDKGRVIVGWATQGDQLIQVIDQSRVRELAESELAAIWRSPDSRINVSETGSREAEKKRTPSTVPSTQTLQQQQCDPDVLRPVIRRETNPATPLSARRRRR